MDAVLTADQPAISRRLRRGGRVRRAGRVRDRVGPGRRLRSAVGLLCTAVVLGLLLAAVLSGIVWAVAGAIHHATTA